MTDSAKDLLDCAAYLRSWQPFKQFVYTDSGEDHHYITACLTGAAAIQRIAQLAASLRKIREQSRGHFYSGRAELLEQIIDSALETTCQHTFDIPYTRLTTAGGETGMECSKCGITNVQVGLAEHARETAPKLPPRETLEDAIRMLVRIQVRMEREDNVGLQWTMTWAPVLKDCPPKSQSDPEAEHE